MLRTVKLVARWGFTALSLLIGILWLMGPRYDVIHGDRRMGVRCFGLSMGAAWYGTNEFGAPGWSIEAAARPIQRLWWFKFKWEPELERMVCVPLWAPLACSLVPTALLWWPRLRFPWRRRRGCCTACGYDRLGLAGDTGCPECGTIPAPASK